MASNIQKTRFHRILIKSLIALGVFLVVVLVLAFLVLAFLPTIASTDQAKRIITDQIEKSLNHPVRIQEIDWTWTNGLVISGIDIPDRPDFSSDQSIIFVDRAILDFRFRELLDRRLQFSVIMKRPEIHLIRNQSGTLNISKVFAGPQPPGKAPGHQAEKEPQPDKPTEPFQLPLDIAADIHLAGIHITYDDRQAEQHFSLDDGDIHLKAPSIVDQPMKAAIAANISVNNQKIPTSTITATIRNVFDSSRQIQLEQLSAQMDATLPGASVHLNGDMTANGIQGEVSLELDTIVAVAAPLLPGGLKTTDIGGKISLTAQAIRTKKDVIEFDAAIAGERLAASGKMLNGKNLGPGDVAISAAGQLNFETYDLNLDRGAIKLLDNTRLLCQGKIKGLNKSPFAIDLAVSPIHINIQEIAAFGKEFLPSELALAQSPAGQTALSIEKIYLHGHMPTGKAVVEVEAASLDASDLIYQTSDSPPAKINLQDSRLNINTLKVMLNDLMPGSVELNAAIQAGDMTYNAGSTRLSLNRFRLEQINITGDDIKVVETSPLGVSGNFEFSDTIDVNSIELNKAFKLNEIKQALDASLAITPEGIAKAALNSLSIRIPDIKVSDPALGPLETSADLDISLSAFRLNSIDNMDLDINDLAARFAAGRMLDLNIRANAEQAGQKHLNASANAEINLAELFKTFNISHRFNISGAGEATLGIQISGKRPNSNQLSGLKALRLNDNLAFLDTCRIDLDLSNGALSYRNDNHLVLDIGQITGTPVLSYELAGKTAAGRLSSHITLSRISEIYILQPTEPASTEFSLDLRHQGTDQISGRQRIQIQPGNFDQSIEISLDGLASAFSQKTPYDIFQRISGKASASVQLPKAEELSKLAVPGMATIELAGGISSYITLQKPPENRMAGNIRLNVSDLSASMPEVFSLDGINGNIELSKAVKIQTATSKTTQFDTEKWLSQQIMEIGGTLQPNEPLESTPINSSFNQIPGISNPETGLSLNGGKFSAAGIPIAIGPSRISLSLSRGLPGIDFLNLDILGGTFRGNLFIDQKSSGYFLETRLNFTGIDPGQIFPDTNAEIQSGESEINGSLFGSIPIDRQMGNVLENAEIHIDFRKIGSRALERLLYALDPYESNEAIVSQRRLLRMGSPRQIRLSLEDGFLSLKGEIAIKSVPIAIPPLRRLNIAQLPGIKKFEASLSAIDPIIHVLDLMAADTVSTEKLFSTQ